MRQETADYLLGLLLWTVPTAPVLLVLQRPAERLGDTVFRYRVLLGLYLGIGVMTVRGGWVVLGYAGLALLALVGIGYLAEAIHNQHLRQEERRKASAR